MMLNWKMIHADDICGTEAAAFMGGLLVRKWELYSGRVGDPNTLHQSMVFIPHSQLPASTEAAENMDWMAERLLEYAAKPKGAEE